MNELEKERISMVLHELRAPLAAIRATVAFIRSRIGQLPEEQLKRKLDDIGLDAESVLMQLSKLACVCGVETLVPTQYSRVLVFRDIIIKTLNQFAHRLGRGETDAPRIQYDPADIQRIGILYLDPRNLNEVVFNVLTNAVKYAEDGVEPAVKVAADETTSSYIIKFQDWGIGVSHGSEERIFEEGYRAPEAIGKYPMGSGMGLTIARALMRQMGGDLQLTHGSKPTEFQVVLPKALREPPRPGALN